MNTSDIPNALPVPSAAAHEDFAHPRRKHRCAQQTADRTRRAPWRTFMLEFRHATGGFEKLLMGLEHEDQVQAIGCQQQQRGPEIDDLLLRHRAFGREETVERARDGQADCRNQHHRTVKPRPPALYSCV
jgi:hypothetical protein